MKYKRFVSRTYRGSLAALFVAFAVGSVAFAQITVTNATFPAAGDVLKMAIDHAPTVVGVATPPGGGQIWDFTGLQVDATQDITYRPAGEGSVGAQVPGAELVTAPSPSGEEYYYNVTSSGFELQAYFGIKPYDLASNSLFHYRPPVPERNAPLNFFDIRAASSGILRGFRPSEFRPELVAKLPFTADSLRYRVAISRIAVVNAWGSLSIPGGTYDVLRENRTLYVETRLDAKVPPLGWLDVTDSAIQAGFNYWDSGGLGVDTLESSAYWSATEKEPIAVVQFGRQGGFQIVEQIAFKYNKPAQPVALDVRVFLQGPYASGAMSTALKTGGILPASQPYNVAPWNYAGAETATSMPAMAVDWVLVSLRATTEASSEVARRAGVLLADGSIVGTDGGSLSFPGVEPGSYHIVVDHRNHLAILSASPVDISSGSASYDFTTSQAKVYGQNAMAEVAPGVFALFAGDSNGVDGVTASDNVAWVQQNGTDGYKSGDFNLNGSITAADAALWTKNNGKGSQVPS